MIRVTKISVTAMVAVGSAIIPVSGPDQARADRCLEVSLMDSLQSRCPGAVSGKEGWNRGRANVSCSRAGRAGLKAPIAASDAVKGAFSIADLGRPHPDCPHGTHLAG